MNSRSKATLFLMEQLIVIAVFALCAAACVRILFSSYSIAIEARDIENAIRISENAAESYKAVCGDLGKMLELLSVSTAELSVGSGEVAIYYDKDLLPCFEADKQAVYLLRIVADRGFDSPDRLLGAQLTVEKLNGDEIIAFPLAARWG